MSAIFFPFVFHTCFNFFSLASGKKKSWHIINLFFNFVYKIKHIFTLHSHSYIIEYLHPCIIIKFFYFSPLNFFNFIIYFATFIIIIIPFIYKGKRDRATDIPVGELLKKKKKIQIYIFHSKMTMHKI